MPLMMKKTIFIIFTIFIFQAAWQQSMKVLSSYLHSKRFPMKKYASYLRVNWVHHPESGISIFTTAGRYIATFFWKHGNWSDIFSKSLADKKVLFLRSTSIKTSWQCMKVLKNLIIWFHLFTLLTGWRIQICDL